VCEAQRLKWLLADKISQEWKSQKSILKFQKNFFSPIRMMIGDEREIIVGDDLI
jgi:hypothetical protein